MSAKTKTRPSSPRKFFARIYGHLEPKLTDEEDTEEKRSKSNESESEDPKVKFQESEQEATREGRPDRNPILPSLRLPFLPHDLYAGGAPAHTSLLPHSTNLLRDFSLQTPAPHHFPGFPAYARRSKLRKNRPRRQRTTFSTDQTHCLEEEYKIRNYISRSRRFELAVALKLTETQIKIWFQNRRAKEKRIDKTAEWMDQRIRLANSFMIPTCPLCGRMLPFCVCNQISEQAANTMYSSSSSESLPRNCSPTSDNVATTSFSSSPESLRKSSSSCSCCLTSESATTTNHSATETHRINGSENADNHLFLRICYA